MKDVALLDTHARVLRMLHTIEKDEARVISWTIDASFDSIHREVRVVAIGNVDGVDHRVQHMITTLMLTESLSVFDAEKVALINEAERAIEKGDLIAGHAYLSMTRSMLEDEILRRGLLFGSRS